MATQEKIAAVSELKELFEASNAVILTEYRGLTVAQLKELRRALGAETEYAVVKNTLAAIAAKEVGIDAFEGHLHGPSALAFIKGDLIDAAKGLRDFAKANPQLIVKNGYYEGAALSEETSSVTLTWNPARFCCPRLQVVQRLPSHASHRLWTHCASSWRSRKAQLPLLPRRLRRRHKPLRATAPAAEILSSAQRNSVCAPLV